MARYRRRFLITLEKTRFVPYNIERRVVFWVKRFWVVFFCLVIIASFASCSESETVTPEFVLTYADNQPENYPTTLGAQYFADLVEEKTGGKIVIDLKFNGIYGTEQEVYAQMQFGGIDFARLSLAAIADEYPKLNALQLPFLYEDADHMWRVLDGEIGVSFLEDFAEIGLVGLSWYDGGARCFYSNTHPIHNPEDMANLRVRVQNSQVVLDMVSRLGAVPMNFAYSDVYYAFQTDKIDVAENNWPAYHSMEHYKVAKYYTVDEHSRIPEVQVASGATWNALPEEYRNIISECAKESALYERKLWSEQEEASRTAVIELGCKEIILSEDARLRFREIVEPLYTEYCGAYMDLVRQIQES